MSWMDWSTALAALLGLAVCFHEWAVSEDDWRPGQKKLAGAGFWILVSTWFVLMPACILLSREGLTAPWLFGAETYDGGVVETVTALGLIAIVLLAARQVLCSSDLRGAGFWAAVSVFGILAFGEEASWGQHLFHWSSSGVFASENLQAETNLHNFISPRVYDNAYALVGWNLILAAGIISIRPRWMGRLLRVAPFAQTSPVGIALLVTAGILLQHEVFEELAEAIAILAFIFIQLHLPLAFQPARQSRRFSVSRLRARAGAVLAASQVSTARIEHALKDRGGA